MKKNHFQWLPVIFLILIGVFSRLLPHPPNFSPIAAIAIFGALYLPRQYAIAIPILAMLVSDYFIGFYNPAIMFSVYICFALTGIIGLMVRKNKKIYTVLGGTILGSIIFFLATNTAVWAFGTLYPPTLTGLMTSYTMAIPFFRNSLLGDLFYVSVLVGGFELVVMQSRKLFAMQSERI